MNDPSFLPLKDSYLKLSNFWIKKSLFILCYCGLPTFASAQVHFQNSAPSIGINHSYEGVPGSGVSFVDFDNDGFDDLTLATGEGQSIYFYKNNNGINFTKISSPIENTDQVKHILWVDFDNDGDYDLYVTTHTNTNRLYKNIGDLTFEDITESAGLPINEFTTYGACFGDVDRDGWLDLYYNDRVPFNTPANRHYLFRNNADGTFTDIAEISNTTDSSSIPFCSAFIDYNNDKWPDIYTSHDRIHNPNILFENNGDATTTGVTFTDVSALTNADVEIDAMCVTPSDFNNDGWMDIYITNTPIAGGSVLLQNLGPLGALIKFGNSATFAGVNFEGRTGWGAVFFDADNDGHLDLYATAADYGDIAQSNAFYLNNGNQTFSQPDAGFIGDTTITYNTAVGDYNNDGYADIAVTNQTPFSTQLWKNNTGGNHFIKIKLQGVLSNRDGIGSKIEVYKNGHYQMRYTLCGNGFMGQNSLTEIIGLVDQENADSILITWPTGHVDKLYNVEHGQSLVIIEGSTTDGDISVDEDIILNIIETPVSSTNKSTAFNIYPNPASNVLFIEKNKNTFEHYFIFNNIGQLLKTIKNTSNNFSINISHLNNGIYFILAVNKNGEKQIEKWVKE